MLIKCIFYLSTNLHPIQPNESPDYHIQSAARANLYKYTAEFEKFSKTIMSLLFFKNAKVELFGTTRAENTFHGTLRTRVETLAKHLGANTTKSFDNNPKYDTIRGGDDGLDIVAFLPMDRAQAIPFAFAQCTCSFDEWKEKQDSVSKDRWNTKIEPLVSYPVFMFVPFSCHNNEGTFYDVTNLRSFLIDRIRIIKIMDKSKDKVFYDAMVAFSDIFSLDELFD